MSSRVVCVAVLAVALAGCSRERWPDAPAASQGESEKAYAEWREQRQATAVDALKTVGIWPLAEGETPFGSDAALPIGLPASGSPARAGAFRRTGDTVTVIPAAGSRLQFAGGGPVAGPSEISIYETVLALGSLRLQVQTMGDAGAERMFVSAWDEEHPAVRDRPSIQAYPVDPRWRVAARFDPFAVPKAVRVADVRGGFMNFTAPGELVFRLNDREHRLTAFGQEGGDELFVMFKDATNGSTTYGGYRILAPAVVPPGEWTVLDFNLAFNPPCAYSRFTTCPLPPPENRLDVAVEAGEQRHPTADGYSE